ncbi:MAG: helix-turn-helix domain-containing protein [Polyangiaceae bacterium]
MAVRKRDFMTRLRDRKRRRGRRRRRPLPTEGWLLRELAKEAGVTPRAVRYYLERRLLPSPAFYGTATRYDRDALLRLCAIQRMRREERLDLEAIRRRLAVITPDQLEAFAPPTLPAAPRPPVTAAATSPLCAAPPPTFASERWERVMLLEGLELMVRSDASSAIRRLAQEIHDHCRAPAPITPTAGI